MHTRPDDPKPLHITREIPLPWLLSAVAAALIQAILIWSGQEKQADATGRLTTQVLEQTKQIQSLTVEIGAKNLKDVEHDLKITDHDRRIGALELLPRK